MPKTTVEQLNPTRVKLLVEVTPDDLKPHIERAYKTVAEQVNIPGFRRGKVPAPIIDQRVGKAVVVEQAVNDSLDAFFQLALAESSVRPMGRPSADIEKWLDAEKFDGTLIISYEVEVRPEFALPKYEGLKLTVDAVAIDAATVDARLDDLRTRFGTLTPVERPARTGDFVEIDLIARIDGAEVDRAAGLSYELGSGNLLDGIDEALDSLTAGETTTFSSVLLGGDHEGENAEVEVTVTAVKERELPEANDEFAQLASEFDTLAELRASIEEEVARDHVFTQGAQARDAMMKELLAQAKIPVSTELVEQEVHRHLESEGRLDDDVHRAEVTEESTTALATQLLLDAIAEAESVQPSQDELSQYIFSAATQYGMQPADFVQALEQNGQIPVIIAEVTRNKALAVALSKTSVVDSAGKAVDLSEYTKVDLGEEESAEDIESQLDAASGKATSAAKKPAAKKPAAKKPAAKKPAAKKPAAKKAADEK